MWCGGGSSATNQVARHYDVDFEPVGGRAAGGREQRRATGPVNWAGPLGRDAHITLDELALSRRHVGRLERSRRASRRCVSGVDGALSYYR